jgi:sucrose-6-phosphate hydrolase SacC (GH32 family)
MKTKNYLRFTIHFIIVFTIVTFCLPGFSQDKNASQKSTTSAIPEDQRPTGYIHDTSIDPFIMTGDGKELGDPMPVYWDGVWHLYSLSVDFNIIVHFTSTDLVRWVEHKPAMVGHDIATGTVLRNENKYYLFYTDGALQNIHVVVSDNPWEFDFSKSKLVAEPDDKVYKKGWFRDAYVFFNEQEKLWWMLFEGRCPEVCAGLLKSKDLLEWKQYEPIFKDENRVYGSCPQIFQQGKLWYLACQDWYNWYYTADTPYGPWKIRGQYISVAIEAASRFATDGKRQITWGWLANFEQLNDLPAPADVYPPTMKLLNYGGPLCVGREMVFKKDGTMGVRPFPELLTAIRNTQNEIDLASVRKLSGEWKIEEAKRTLQCNGNNGGIVLLDLPGKNPNYYFESEIEFGSSLASTTIIVRSSDKADKGYGFTLSPANKKIAIRGFNYSADHKVLNDKEYSFPGKNKVNLQIFIFENNIEVFIDGQECLSARTVDRTYYKVAIEVSGGSASIRKPFLHYFRNKKEQ